MGGSLGRGAIVVERDEPVFHRPWEGRVNAMMRHLIARGLFNLDQFRYAVERIPADDYLRSSYYERWLTAIERLVRESEAVVSRAPLPERFAPPTFAVGDKVVVRKTRPPGHTRMAHYVWGKRGTIESIHGPFMLPDTRASLIRADWQPVYTVVFDASELWGPDAEAPRERMSIDLWQSYLEDAS